MILNSLGGHFNRDVTLIALVLLAGGIALWWIGNNRLLQAGGILIAIPGLAGVALFLNGELRKERFAERTLRSGETVEGVRLSTGTKVTENYRLMPGSEKYLVGVTLARDEQFDGIPCRAGEAQFRDGKLAQCELSKPFILRRVACPAGTRVSDVQGDRWSLVLPAEAPPLNLAGFTIPPGSSLTVSGNPPQIKSVTMPATKESTPSIEVNGIRMITAVEFHDDGTLEGALGEDATVDGVLRKNGEWVHFRSAERVSR